MRFTSLIIELIRARPRLVVWIVVLIQALLWLVVPMLFYGSPPGDLATVLAYGHQYQVGSDRGPPLAFWLADVAFRLAGGHIFGVYLLAQLCFVVTFAALYGLARRIVGNSHAALAVLLTMTVTAFSFPGVEFGPLVLACPLWALVLLHAWQVIGQGSRNAWFALSIEAGLLLLTTYAAIGLLLLLAVFALATAQGRRTLLSFDALFAVLVIVVLVFPYLVWLLRADALALPHGSQMADITTLALGWGRLLGWLMVALAGIVLLIVLNSALMHRTILRNRETSPTVFRASVSNLARQFVLFFALAPALLGSLIGALLGYDHVAGGAGIALLLSGLAVIVFSGDLIHLRRQRVLRTAWAAVIVAPAVAIAGMTLLQPWFGDAEIATTTPANAIARFFGDSFQRRTNRPLPAVAGDTRLAELIALGASRPLPLLATPPALGPWLKPQQFNEAGGVVVWRAADTAGTPPAAIAKEFPGLVPEVPKTFDRLVDGRYAPLRVGWAIVRPKTP
jgi:hypothetical protein